MVTKPFKSGGIEMTKPIADISLRQAAIIGGVAYLIMTVVALFANFFIRSSLIVWGDAATTANNIIDSESLFRIGIASFAVMLVCDVLVAWALFVFLKPVNKSLSILTAWFRLVYTSIHGIALVGLVLALLLLTSADYSTVFETGQLNALALLFLNGHEHGWIIGEVFFGFHLFLLGYLVYRSDYIPRILGAFLIVGGLAYLTNDFANFLLANYADYEAALIMVVAVPSMIGELGLAVWLLVKGRKVQLREGEGQGGEDGPGGGAGRLASYEPQGGKEVLDENKEKPKAYISNDIE